MRSSSPRTTKAGDPPNVILGIDEVCQASPILKGKLGHAFARLVMNIFGISEINRLYDSASQYRGIEACCGCLDYMRFNYLVGNAANLDKIPSEGAFVTVSNHPYGGPDGLVLVDLVSSKRRDYRIIVNNVLARAKTLGDAFITVTPTTTEKKSPDAVTMNGVKAIVKQISDGHGLGCFPAGAISNYKRKACCSHDRSKPKPNRLQDREWQPSMLRIIQRAKVPVIPIYFPDRNSRFFYFLGQIHWKLRLLRLPWEFFNKNKGTHRVIVGEPISVEEQAKCPDLESYGRLLRSAVYDMPLPASYSPRKHSR